MRKNNKLGNANAMTHGHTRHDKMSRGVEL
jgi:hypothetical protein